MSKVTARKLMRNRKVNRVEYYEGLLARLQYDLRNDADNADLQARVTELEGFVENTADADLGKATWNDGDAEGTVKVIAMPPDINVLDDTLYQILVHNTAPVGVNVQVDVLWTDIDGNQRQSPLTNWDVEAEKGSVQLVQAALLGEGCALKLTSAGAISGASYETYVEIRKV